MLLIHHHLSGLPRECITAISPLHTSFQSSLISTVNLATTSYDDINTNAHIPTNDCMILQPNRFLYLSNRFLHLLSSNTCLFCTIFLITILPCKIYLCAYLKLWCVGVSLVSNTHGGVVAVYNPVILRVGVSLSIKLCRAGNCVLVCMNMALLQHGKMLTWGIVSLRRSGYTSARR